MLAFKLAFKNLIGAGLRTWLNVAVLSFSFIIIIFYNGMIDGWNQQARTDTRNWEIGNGLFWHPEYDPLDMYTFKDAHAPLSNTVNSFISEGKLTPVLLTQATAYPQGRMQNILLKGIPREQTIVDLPTEKMVAANGLIPALVGKRMAENLKLKEGELLLIRWRDKNGTFDAREVQISTIFDCNVPNIDNGQIWVPIDNLREMMNLPNEATYLVVSKETETIDIEGWTYKSLDFLLKDLDTIIQSKKGGSNVFSGLLLIIALLAIFDTQVLSIFRRQKEIGTYIALGMTRWDVVKIFTVEGSTYSILAAMLAAVYGTPLFYYMAKNGYTMPQAGTDMGVSVADVIYPTYGIGLILTTILIVVLASTIVSFLPARKIARLKPTDALKGKIQ